MESRTNNQLNRVCFSQDKGSVKGSSEAEVGSKKESGWRRDHAAINVSEQNSIILPKDLRKQSTNHGRELQECQPYKQQIDCCDSRGLHGSTIGSIDGVPTYLDSQAPITRRIKRVDPRQSAGSRDRSCDFVPTTKEPALTQVMSCNDADCGRVIPRERVYRMARASQAPGHEKLEESESPSREKDETVDDRLATGPNHLPDSQPVNPTLGKLKYLNIGRSQHQTDDSIVDNRLKISRIVFEPNRNTEKKSETQHSARLFNKLFEPKSCSNQKSTTAGEVSERGALYATGEGVTVNKNRDSPNNNLHRAKKNIPPTKTTFYQDLNENSIDRLVGKVRLQTTVNPVKPLSVDETSDWSKIINTVHKTDLYAGDSNSVPPALIGDRSDISSLTLSANKLCNKKELIKHHELKERVNSASNIEWGLKIKEATMVATINFGAGKAIKSSDDNTFEALGDGTAKNSFSRRMVWKNLAIKYGMMQNDRNSALGQGQLMTRMRRSCCYNLMTSSLRFMFPIFSSFKNYSFPGDFVADLLAGFTVAILHIPQGMAYGLLAGVEPIYGLYVSLFPVLIMALMSKSYNVSYGTFAVISMLLFNCQESVKNAFRQEQQVPFIAGSYQARGGVNLTDLRLASLGQAETRQDAGRVLPSSYESTGNLILGSGTNDGSLILTNNHKPPMQYSTQELLMSLIPRLVNRKDFQSVNNEDQPSGSSKWSLSQSLVSSAATSTISSISPDVAIAVEESVIPSSMEILTCICLVVGLLQISMAIMRLGFLSLMFSDQLVSSFTTASAIQVMTSQLGGMFDIQLGKPSEGLFKVFRIWYMFATKMYDGFNQYTGIITLLSLLFLLNIKELVEPALKRRCKSLPCLPSELILMAVLIFCSSYWNFATDYDILIIGKVPTGLPVPQTPRLDLVPIILEDALVIAVISFAMNLSVAQSYAKKNNVVLEPNQELFALGVTNAASSFFSCFPCAASLSRTAVQSSLNVKSQLCPLISCTVVLSVICYLAPVFHDLPRSTLSCIIVVALRGVILQIGDFFANWRLSKLDAFVWAVTFTAVLALDVTYGLIVGIIASLLKVFYQLLTPTYSVLGRLPGTDIFVDRDAFAECKEIDGVKIFKFNSPLCYLNRVMFKSGIKKMVKLNHQRDIDPNLIMQQHAQKQAHLNAVDSQNNYFSYLIVDCSGLAYCDFSGATTLAEVIDELQLSNVTVFLAACPLKLIGMFERMNRTKLLEENVYPTIASVISHIEHMKIPIGSSQGLHVSIG